MQVDAKDVEKAIVLLKDAIRADRMFREASSYYFAPETWNEIKKNVEDHTSKALRAMRKIPAVGKLCLWNPDDFPPLAKSDVPASLLHICIYEEARGEFGRPNPLGELQEGWWEGFYSNPSEEMKSEWEFRCKFADLLDYIRSGGDG